MAGIRKFLDQFYFQFRNRARQFRQLNNNALVRENRLRMIFRNLRKWIANTIFLYFLDLNFFLEQGDQGYHSVQWGQFEKKQSRNSTFGSSFWIKIWDLILY